MLAGLRSNPTDAWLIDRLLAAGYRILGITKYPTAEMLARKDARLDRQLARDGNGNKFRLKNLDASPEERKKLPRQTQLAQAEANQKMILAALAEKPWRLTYLSKHIGLSDATTKRHLDLLVVARKIYKDIQTKEFKLKSA